VAKASKVLGLTWIDKSGEVILQATKLPGNTTLLQRHKSCWLQCESGLKEEVVCAGLYGTTVQIVA